MSELPTIEESLAQIKRDILSNPIEDDELREAYNQDLGDIVAMVEAYIAKHGSVQKP